MPLHCHLHTKSRWTWKDAANENVQIFVILLEKRYQFTSFYLILYMHFAGIFFFKVFNPTLIPKRLSAPYKSENEEMHIFDFIWYFLGIFLFHK